MDLRKKSVDMMNTAMERQAQEQPLDARSWADQGRPDLAVLVKPSRAHVDELQEQRAELPAPHLKG